MSRAVISFEAVERDGDTDNVDLLLEYYNAEGEKVAFDSTQVSHQLATCVHTVTLRYPDQMANLLRQAVAKLVDEE